VFEAALRVEMRSTARGSMKCVGGCERWQCGLREARFSELAGFFDNWPE
jgi:hypothetical protein